MQACFGVSERRVCAMLPLARNTLRYRPQRQGYEALILRIRDIATARPRFGYQRVLVMLRREGWKVNHKLVYRLYREEGLNLRQKRRIKRGSHLRVPPTMALSPNERWSMDFVMDELTCGRRFRVLTMVDNWNRFSPMLRVDFSLRGTCVAAALEEARVQHGLPKIITVDNGSEFISRALGAYAYEHGIRLDFIRPGKPVENALIESFNRRLRDECLNANLFFTFADARQKIEAWRKDYNQDQPHSALGDFSPLDYTAKHRKNRVYDAAAV